LNFSKFLYYIYEGKAKGKGIYKKEASQPREKEENKEQRKFLCLLRGKGNSLPPKPIYRIGL